MKHKTLFSTGLMLAVGLGIMTAADAQTTYTQYTPVQTQYTQTTVQQPMSTTTTVQQPLTGQTQMTTITNEHLVEPYQTNARLWGEVRPVVLTLQPGRGQFSVNDLGINDAVNLTLVNPTDQPLRFMTSKRLGSEVVAVVPPRSQQVVQFAFNKPISDEVEFLVYEEPVSAISQLTAPQTQAVTTTTTPQVIVVEQPAPVQQPVTQSRSTVRGYW